MRAFAACVVSDEVRSEWSPPSPDSAPAERWLVPSQLVHPGSVGGSIPGCASASPVGIAQRSSSIRTPRCWRARSGPRSEQFSIWVLSEFSPSAPSLLSALSRASQSPSRLLADSLNLPGWAAASLEPCAPGFFSESEMLDRCRGAIQVPRRAVRRSAPRLSVQPRFRFSHTRRAPTPLSYVCVSSNE